MVGERMQFEALTRPGGRRSFSDMEESIRTRQWTRAEYDHLIDIGVFRPGEAIELIGGDLIVAEPQSGPHYTSIYLAEDALRAAFGPGWLVRTQAPIALDDQSEPEPDVAVALGTPRQYAGEHPARPVLVVEVALTSLALDRLHKGSLYARGGVEDYWIVNLVDRVLEIYRQPITDTLAPFGWRYGSRQTLGSEASVSPLAAPEAQISVAAFLP
jgi:Uma2 family endonuclease